MTVRSHNNNHTDRSTLFSFQNIRNICSAHRAQIVIDDIHILFICEIEIIFFRLNKGVRLHCLDVTLHIGLIVLETAGRIASRV